MATCILAPNELRRRTLREVFRANVGIGEFESLGRSFPDIALHYTYVSFDSFAHYENCPCASPGDCDSCFFVGGNVNEVSYDYIFSAYINASLADLLVQRFLVLDYEKKVQGMMALTSMSPRMLEGYLKTNATKEEKEAVSSYRAWCEKHDSARRQLKDFLSEKDCSTLAIDLVRMVEDIDPAEIERCVCLFRDYASTAREMYYAYQAIIPINQKIESNRKRNHQVITHIEWVMTAVGVIVLMGKMTGFIG